MLPSEWARLPLRYPEQRLERQVARHARERPADVTVIAGDATLSWGDLDALADGLAGYLAAQGFRQGDRIGWLSRNRIDFPILLVAARRLGLVLTGFNFRLSAHEVAATVAIGRPRLVVVEDEYRALLPGEVPQLAVGDAFFAAARAGHVAKSAPVDPEAPCTLFFTSGSTGLPKGVLFGARATEDTVYGLHTLDLDTASRPMIVAPLFHTAGWIWCQYGLAAGMTQILAASAAPDDMLDGVAHHGATHAQWLPTMLHLAVAEQIARPRDLSTLRMIAYGSSPIAPQLLAQVVSLFGCEFSQVYGLTETIGPVGHLPPSAHRCDWGGAGTPTVIANPDVELRCVDESGVAVPPGHDGEIHARLPIAAPRYVTADGEASVADADGWIATGDMGSIDAEGFVRLIGRNGDMIITGGENVYPVEVENMIAGFDGVDQVAVFGQPDPRWGQRVCAAIVPKPGAEVHAAEIIERCRSRIAHYKAPRIAFVVDALPRNATGKVVRGALPRLLLDRTED